MNMCSVRHKPIPCAPNSRAFAASSGVSAFARTLQAAVLVRPAENGLEVLVDLGRHELDRADDDDPAPAVDRDHVSLGQVVLADPDAVILGVDAQLLTAGDARLAHAAGHHRRVRGHAAVRGEDSLRGDHPVDVVGRGLPADEDQGLGLAPQRGGVGVEHDLAGRRAR
jgi:hypothetical protein